TRFYYRDQRTGDRSFLLPQTHPGVAEVDDDGPAVDTTTVVAHHSLTPRVPTGHDLRLQVAAKNPPRPAGDRPPALIRYRTLHGLR
ncbi:hypothetical protein ACLQ2E_36025, partial [Streptomyces lavendulocolor]